MGWQDREYAGEQGYRDSFSRGGGFGGGGFGSRLGKQSVVTWLLVANVVIFLLNAILLGSTRGNVLAPEYWGRFTIEQGIYRFQIWRLLTFQFLHADFFHILFNMIALYFFGPMLEAWWGSKRFLVFYLLCGVSGALVFTLLAIFAPGVIFPAGYTGGETVSLIGASGGIYGILIGAAVLFPHQRVMLLFPPIPMKLRTMALIFIGLAVLGLLAGSRNAGGEAAHLGGVLVGYLLIKRPGVIPALDRVSPQAVRDGLTKGRWEKKQQQAAALEAEVDRILEKVRTNGLQSLSRKERKTLQRATEEQKRAG